MAIFFCFRIPQCRLASSHISPAGTSCRFVFVISLPLISTIDHEFGIQEGYQAAVAFPSSSSSSSLAKPNKVGINQRVKFFVFILTYLVSYLFDESPQWNSSSIAYAQWSRTRSRLAERTQFNIRALLACKMALVSQVCYSLWHHFLDNIEACRFSWFGAFTKV